jgi:hypothetical protein
MAHDPRYAPLNEISRSCPVGGRRMILSKGIINGAFMILGGEDRRSIVVVAVEVAVFRIPPGEALVATEAVVMSSYFSRRNVR